MTDIAMNYSGYSEFYLRKQNMDALLTFLIDVVFYFIGKSIWWLMRKSRLPIPEFSHWGYVVFGFFVFSVFIIFIFFMLG